MTLSKGWQNFAARFPAAARWYIVGLLCLLSAISYIDRYVIALLAEPIGRALKVGDTQIGLLMGLGFGVIYSLVGIPIAHLLDHRSRVRILAISVLLWSLCTCASAIAPSYAWLLILRAGVAIGEAALTPAAVSLIGDLFEKERRTLPVAVFMAVAAVMGSGAFIIGGLAFRIAELSAPYTGLAGWRMTLLLVGAPGLLMAALWLATVREPRRAGQGGDAPPIPVAAALAYVRENLRLYGFLLLGVAVISISGFAFLTWTATVLIRSFAVPLAEAGMVFGLSSLAGGVAGALLWPAWHAWNVRRGREDATLWVIASGFGLGCAMLAAYPLAQDSATLLILSCLANFGFSVSGSPVVLALQEVVPARLRARIISLYVFAVALVGLTVGPTLAAVCAMIFDGPDAMRHGLCVVALVIGPLSVGSICLSHKPYAAAVRIGR